MHSETPHHTRLQSARHGTDRGRTESFVAPLLRELVQRLAVQCIQRKELQARDALSFGAVELELLQQLLGETCKREADKRAAARTSLKW